MRINLMVLLAVVGAFLVFARPFTGALWVGIALFVGGFYWAYRYAKNIRKKNESMSDYEKYR